MPTDTRILASRMLALTLGDASAAARVTDWNEIYAFSVQQRCAALMWHRCGAAIREHAPADVVSRWRQQALKIAEHGSALLKLLGETQALLDSAGVQSIAVKGPPLAIRLHGTPIARPIGDLDLFVPARDRQRAREALVAAGWMHSEGGRGTDWEVLVRMDGEERRWLDLLSQIPKQLPGGESAPPESERAVFEGVPVRMHSGPGVPNHLAVHLAKHDFPPLLWFVDFDAAWHALGDAERQDARARAGRMGIQRYLEWALDRAAAIRRAAAGEHVALDLLGFTASGRVQPRRWRRELALAGSPMAGLRLIARAVFPPTARTPLAFLRRIAVRLRHPRRWLLDRRRFELSESVGERAGEMRGREATVEQIDGMESRALQLDGTEFRDTVREALAAGATVWLRATGSSNEPTIPRDATVRVRPRRGPLRVGDMVLVLGRDRRPLLHRVRWVKGSRIVTIGDARLENDQVASLEEVVGIVDAVAVSGGTRPVSSGYPTALWIELVRLRRQVAMAAWRLLHRRESSS